MSQAQQGTRTAAWAGPAEVVQQHVDLARPVDDPSFGSAVMLRVSELAGRGVQGEQHATLDLNPAEMGPIRILLCIRGDQAQVDFGAAQAHTRELIESALPALASALHGDGLTLTDARVFQLPDTASAPGAAVDAPAAGDAAGASGAGGGGNSRQPGGDAGAQAAARALLAGAAALGVERAQRLAGGWGEAADGVGGTRRRSAGGGIGGGIDGGVGLDLYA